MNNNKNCKIFLFFLFLFFNSLWSVGDSDSLDEKFDKFLSEIKEERKTLSQILTGRKVNQLSFLEAVLLYLAAEKEKDAKYKLEALVRMYHTCPHKYFGDMILWQLACEYEKIGNYVAAMLAFEQFKKMFPGSSAYWVVRMGEIRCAYQICLAPAYDNSYAEKLIELCRQYILDCKDNDSSDYQDVIKYMSHGYKIILEKSIGVLRHYLTKYFYSNKIEALYACIQRVENILYMFEAAQDYEFSAEDETSEKINTSYKELINQAMQNCIDFFKTHSIVMGKGKEFIVSHNAINVYLKENKDAVVPDIKSLIFNFEKTMHEITKLLR